MYHPYEGFENFDQEDIYQRYESALLRTDTRNVIVDFDNNTSFAALDVGSTSVKKILQAQRSGDARTKWIILLGPHRQTDIVDALAEHYAFSPRLRALMRSDPDTPSLYQPVINFPNYNGEEDASQNQSHRSSQSDDPEKRAAEIIEQDSETLDLNHYRFVSHVWHHNSVDFGPKFLCIGYNSLSNPKAPKSMKNLPEFLECINSEQSPGHRPDGFRLWAWLIICDDGTVISMHENPSFVRQANPAPNEEDLKNYILSHGRRNLLKTFEQLSKCNERRKPSNPFMTLGIRSASHITDESLPDMPCLLFYYLFDDWVPSYSLVIRDSNQYTAKLEKLRNEMMDRPNFDLVKNLHSIGRQLADLKRVYESYIFIIDSILEEQPSIDNPTGRRPLSEDDNRKKYLSRTLNTPKGVTANFRQVDDSGAPQLLGVRLSQAAALRFKRLKDRIDLYALREIEDCLDQKESLVLMNFNLITLVESGAIERLTRITILLAKVTILFMPISLMTAYFSVQVKGINDAYDIKTYWGSFAVVIFLSLLALWGFESISDVIDRSHKSTLKEYYTRTKAADKIWRKRNKSA